MYGLFGWSVLDPVFQFSDAYLAVISHFGFAVVNDSVLIFVCISPISDVSCASCNITDAFVYVRDSFTCTIPSISCS